VIEHIFSMKRTTIDQTDLSVSRIALGTASLHHLKNTSNCQELLHAAHDSGITHFDTSPYYGYGLAERELGKFLRGRRGDVTVASKIGLHSPGWTPAGRVGVLGRKIMGRVHTRFSAPRIDWTMRAVTESLHRSLEYLQTDYLDLLLLHEPSPTLIDAERILPWLESQKAAGLIRWWGVAGPAERSHEWIQQHHPISQVIQMHDTVAGGNDDVVRSIGRPIQFTYGYLRDAERGATGSDTMRLALQRNKTGSVLVSTRRVERISELALVAE
jgi:aryl-alcohol dehydrogenase-like predicted oxidoreductase